MDKTISASEAKRNSAGSGDIEMEQQFSYGMINIAYRPQDRSTAIGDFDG